MAEEKEVKKDKIKWKEIIITAVITASLSLIVGIALFYYQNRQGKLIYTVEESTTFSGDTSYALIYSINIKNEGKNYIQDVKSVVEIANGNIQDYKLDISNAIDKTITSNDTSIEISLPYFNQDEELTVQVYALGENKSPSAKVDLRGSGIVGTDRTGYKLSNIETAADLISIAGAIIVFSLLIFGKFILKSEK